jgi:Leucine-rich repeat (LRR) protein
LKRIDLSNSQNLIRTPDLSGIPNLEKLELRETSLSKVHPSIGFLRRLKELDLRDCKNLKRLADVISLESLEDLNLSGCSRLNKFPDIVGHMTSLRKLYLMGTAIKKLPLSFTSLSSLVFLNISNCSRLEEIPMELSGLECLEFLYADGTAIRQLPPSIVFLKKLRILDVFGCKHGSYPGSLLIPNSFLGLSSLYKLNMSYCNLLDGAIPNDLSCLSSLCFLNLSGNYFMRIPDSVAQLSHLQKLYLENCCWLQVLPKLPLELAELYVNNCPSLDTWLRNENFQFQIFDNPRRLNFDWSVSAAYIDYDGKPCKIFHLPERRNSVNWGYVSLLLFFLTHIDTSYTVYS